MHFSLRFSGFVKSKPSFVVAILLTAGTAGLTRAANLSKWMPLQEPSNGGHTTCVSISPYDSKRVLAGGDILGIALSTDGGSTWQGTYGLSCWEIASFTWHPTDSNTVWSAVMGGPYVSRDGGTNWTLSRNGFPAVSYGNYSAPIQKILFDPGNPSRLLAFGGNRRGYGSWGQSGGVWQSVNSGTNWALLSTILSGGNIMNVTYAGGSSNRIYAAVDNYGVVVSEDSGTNWTPRNNGLPTTNDITDIAAYPGQPNTAVVAVYRYPIQGGVNYASGGIWWTTNGGTNWSACNNGIPQNTNTSANAAASVTAMGAVAIAPTNPQKWATSDKAYNDSGVYLTSNSGANWTKNSPTALKLADGFNFDVITFDPNNANILFVCGGDAILRSTNGGTTWTNVTLFQTNSTYRRGTGFSGWVALRLVFHPTKRGCALFAGMDDGYGWHSEDGLVTWARDGVGLPTWGGAADIGMTTNNWVFMNCGQAGTFGGIARSQNGGTNFTMLYGATYGLPNQNAAAPPGGIFCFPDNPTNVWAVVGSQLYGSTNAGNSWSALTAGSTPQFIAGFITNGTRTVYATCSDGVYQAANGAGAFTKMSGSPTSTARVTVDSWGRLYVLPWRQSNGGVWRYANNTWTRITTNKYLQDIAVDPVNPQRMMAVSSDDPYYDSSYASGIWTSEDDGVTWQQQNTGLADLRVKTVAVCPYDPDLWIVGTDGRGYFVARWAPTQVVAQRTNSVVTWNILGPPNQTAVLQSSANLTTWQPIATNQMPPLGWQFSVTPTNGANFYRVSTGP